LVFIVIWSVYGHGMRNISATERTLESTRAAHILFELLHRDLTRAREVAIPQSIMKVSGLPFEKGDALIFIDLKEYAFRKREKRVYVGGRLYRMGLFDEVSFEIVRPGVVKFVIVTAPSNVGAEAKGVQRGGRFRLEGQVCVERICALERNPTQVEEFKETHKYCLGSWALDY